MNPVRLAAFDLDGTLMGADMQIRPRVRHAIARAQERGVVVTLATGRMFEAALPFARTLNVTAPLICYQGGWIQAPGDAEPRYRVPLATPLARAGVELGEAQGWHIVLYADARIYVRELLYPREFYVDLLGPALSVGEPWDEILEVHTSDKVLFVGEPEAIPGMSAILREHVGAEADVIRSHANFVEIVPRGVDKGRALAWLAEHMGIARENVLAAGDQENDLAMVRWAGLGVAMGNAISSVQRAARWVGPSLEEDGVAVALERFVLGEED